MHSLDVIILKNARAAGREAAHAHNDQTLKGDEIVLGSAYAQAEERDRFGNIVERAFTAGWNAGKQEG